MAITFKDSDILNAMQRELDKDPMVYGANGHYSVGAYYNLFGEPYNKESNVTDAEETPAAQGYMEHTDEENIALGLI